MRSLKFIQVYSSYQGAQLDSTLTLLLFFFYLFWQFPYFNIFTIDYNYHLVSKYTF